MITSLTVLAALVAAPSPAPTGEVATELRQVAPDASALPWAAPAKVGDKTRAVVLIHGLFVHPVRPAKAAQPWCRDWQEPKSELVKALAKDFDVFAFAYAQVTTVDDVARGVGLGDAVARLRKAGYKEVVLVGHSAGGIIARQFAEQFPDAGVTKVIAVAAPFAGVDLAAVNVGYPKAQAPFVKSLTHDARREAVRANKTPLGKDVQFACVVGKLKLVETDGLVSTNSQWPEDLQRLGVPIVLAPHSHYTVMQNAAAAKTIADLAREKLTRWAPDETERARKILFGEAREK